LVLQWSHLAAFAVSMTVAESNGDNAVVTPVNERTNTFALTTTESAELQLVHFAAKQEAAGGVNPDGICGPPRRTCAKYEE
jgi:hypothetical protein